MLIDISRVKVSNRIRQDYGDIEDLANDIKENGLINPPVVTPNFELIAGERRLRAMKYLGYQQVEVRVMQVKDYEHMLKLEINENENRKDFTRLERLEYARRLERIERVKARERMQNPTKNSSEGETQEIVAKKAGIGSKDTYRKEKYIAKHADKETLEAWDKRKISTHKAYTRIKELEEQVKKLQQKNRELKERKPEVIEKEVVKEVIKVPGDYEELKEKEKHLTNAIEDLRIKMQSQVDSKDYNRLRKEYEQKVNEVYDLKDQLKQTIVTDSEEQHRQKLKDTALTFSAKVHNFINSTGGLAWLTDYIDELGEYEKKEYIKAIDLLESWVLTVKSNINKEEF